MTTSTQVQRSVDFSHGPTDTDQVTNARRGVLAYLIVVVTLSAVLDSLIVTTRILVPLAVLLMCVPSAASVGVRLARREGFADVSFRFGGRRGLAWLAIGLILPWIVGAVAYGIAWQIGVAEFVLPEQLAGEPNALARVGLLCASWLAGLPTACALAAGEEIGWRGYMLTRLIDGRTPCPVLASGLIWGFWHAPLILAGLYAAGPEPVPSVVLFMFSITAMSFVLARMRLETGSIWPTIACHGAWNLTIQGVFDQFTAGGSALTWTGESGILVAVVAMLIAGASLRLPGPFRARRERIHGH